MTASTNFPVTAGVVQPAYAGQRDLFVVKLNLTASTLSGADVFIGKLSEPAPPSGVPETRTTSYAYDGLNRLLSAAVN